MPANLLKLTDTLLSDPDVSLSYDDARDIFATNRYDMEDILYCSDKLRKNRIKSPFFICSIINAKSGKCSQDCAFCAQSSFHKTGVDVYPLLSAEEMAARAVKMEENGATRFSIVTSGLTLSDEEIARVCKAVEMINQKTSLTVCGSLGMLNKKKAKALFAAGMKRYHHNLETAKSHFDKICTTHPWEDDIATINIASQAGFQVCTGAIFGMGESWDQRVELAFTLKGLPIDAVPVNFLTPVKGTALEALDPMTVKDALKCIALLRFIVSDKSITICGGRETILKDYQSWIFRAGADGIMTGNYLTLKGRRMTDDMTMLKDLYDTQIPKR